MHPLRLRHTGIAGDAAGLGGYAAGLGPGCPTRRARPAGDAGTVGSRSGGQCCTADRAGAGARSGLGHDERRRPLDRDQRRAALHRPAAGPAVHAHCARAQHGRDRTRHAAGLLDGNRAFDVEHAEHRTDPRTEHGAQHDAERLDAERHR